MALLTWLPAALLPAVLQYAWYEPLKDWYAAYNKPGAVVDYFEHNSPKEEWVVVLDSDMLLKTPFKVRMESSSGGGGSMSIWVCLGGGEQQCWRTAAAGAFKGARCAHIFSGVMGNACLDVPSSWGDMLLNVRVARPYMHTHVPSICPSIYLRRAVFNCSAFCYPHHMCCSFPFLRVAPGQGLGKYVAH